MRGDAVLEVDYAALHGGVPHELDELLALFDGRRTLDEVREQSMFTDEDTARIVARLRRDKLLVKARATAPLDALHEAELQSWLAGSAPAGRVRRWLPLGAAGVTAALIVVALVRPGGGHRMAAATAALTPPAPAPSVTQAPAPRVTPAPSPAPTPPAVQAAPAPTEPEPPPIADAAAQARKLTATARAQLDKGRAKAALASAQAAVALDDRAAEAWLVIGAAQQEFGKNADARAAYEKYLALAPKGAFAGEIRSVLRTLR